MNNGVKPDWKFLLAHPAHFLALGFGSGLSPKAPGTAGTVAAIPVYLLIVALGNDYLYAVITLLVIGTGFWICGFTERKLGAHDHASIVWDEIAGFLITMFLAPITWWSVLAGFLFFRVFDILKPYPVSWFDAHLQGGFGTMIDDVMAGVYAWFAMQIFLFVWAAQ